MRTRLKSWCQSTTSGRDRGGRCRGCLASVYLCRCCCGPESGDKDCRNRPLNSHLEKCQSFYQGLSQTGPQLGNTGGHSGSLSGHGGHHVGGPYHPSAFTASAKKSRTLGFWSTFGRSLSTRKNGACDPKNNTWPYMENCVPSF